MAFDNSMDGVANRKDEVRKSSVEEMDPLDSASQEGDRNTESDDELIAGIVDGMLEIGNEGNVKRGAKSPAEEQQVVKQRKKNKLGLPEVKDRVWVKNSESDETNNYEVVKSKDPDNPQCGLFECKGLDGGGAGELVVDFYEHQWGYQETPMGWETESGSPPFYGFPSDGPAVVRAPDPPPVTPPQGQPSSVPQKLPPRHRRNSSRSGVIKSTNSLSQ